MASDLLFAATSLVKKGTDKGVEGKLEEALEILHSAKETLMKYITHKAATYEGRVEVAQHIANVENQILLLEKKVPNSGRDNDEKLKNNFKRKVTKGFGKTKWDDIAGYDHIKKLIRTKIVRPLNHPHLFRGAHPNSSNLLLFGPPGCGKTLFAKAIAGEVRCNFMQVGGSDIFSQYVGATEKNIRALFSVARDMKPCVVFLDEIDCFLVARDENSDVRRGAVTEFLSQTDNADPLLDNTGIILLGATNQPWTLDKSGFRRFGARVYIDLPDEETRRSIFARTMNKSDILWEFRSCDFDPADKVAEQLHDYSGADISLLVNDLKGYRWEMLESAKYFKIVGIEGRDDRERFFWTPCCRTDEGAVQSTADEIDPKMLLLPRINWEIVQRCIKNRPPTMNTRVGNPVDENPIARYFETRNSPAEIIKRFEAFNEDFGLKIDKIAFRWEDPKERMEREDSELAEELDLLERLTFMYNVD